MEAAAKTKLPGRNISFPFFHKLDHAGGQFRIEGQSFACNGVIEGQRTGMKSLSGQKIKTIPYELLVFCKPCSPQYLIASVFSIVKERVFDIA